MQRLRPAGQVGSAMRWKAARFCGTSTGTGSPKFGRRARSRSCATSTAIGLANMMHTPTERWTSTAILWAAETCSSPCCGRFSAMWRRKQERSPHFWSVRLRSEHRRMSESHRIAAPFGREVTASRFFDRWLPRQTATRQVLQEALAGDRPDCDTREVIPCETTAN
jgi:hypothetical protein